MAKRVYLYTGIFLWLTALTMVFLPSWPHLYYRLFPNTSRTLAQTIAETAPPKDQSLPNAPQSPLSPEPDTDPSLPKENGVIIPAIGVRGEIHEGSNWEDLLKKGIWRVPDFGTPDQNNLPIILAAHRYGYLDWSPSFRKLNSFYNLPNLKVGDTISLVWNQKQYEYKIYSTSVGTQIPEYNANLILYTCQLWNSPQRFFVFANRINP